MSSYLDEKNPEKHKPFDDASPDIVAYVRYLEVIAGKSPNTAFSYYCDLRNFSRFMKRRRGLVTDDTEIKDIDPKGLDTAFWGSVTKEDVYEYLYFLNSECGNKKSSTARRLASLHGFCGLSGQSGRLAQRESDGIHQAAQTRQSSSQIPDSRAVHRPSGKHPDSERFPGAGLLHGRAVFELWDASFGACRHGPRRHRHGTAADPFIRQRP